MRSCIAAIASTCLSTVALADPPSLTPPSAPPPVFVRQGDGSSSAPAWIATGIASGFVVGAFGWWLYSDRYIFGHGGDAVSGCVPNYQNNIDINNCNAVDAGVDHRRRVWYATEFALGAGAVGATVIAAFLWSQHEGVLHRVTVTPTPTGAAVWLGGRF